MSGNAAMMAHRRASALAPLTRPARGRERPTRTIAGGISHRRNGSRAQGRRAVAQALLAATLAWTAPAALPCSPVPIQQRELERSTVIATGTVHIVELTEQRNPIGPNAVERIVEGIAELRADTIAKNESGAASPFLFRFRFLHAPDCLDGYLPQAGERARVHLARNADQPAPAIFFIVHYEPIDP